MHSAALEVSSQHFHESLILLSRGISHKNNFNYLNYRQIKIWINVYLVDCNHLKKASITKFQ